MDVLTDGLVLAGALLAGERGEIHPEPTGIELYVYTLLVYLDFAFLALYLGCAFRSTRLIDWLPKMIFQI